jgi:hypothetical protein
VAHPPVERMRLRLNCELGYTLLCETHGIRLTYELRVYSKHPAASYMSLYLACLSFESRNMGTLRASAMRPMVG